MTPNEVFQEIQVQDPREQEFIARLKRKGLITEIPTLMPNDDSRTRFRRIEVKGEPLSETIIEERR